ncbi:hypothetical protein [Halomonas sp. BMC6]|uniref:hypothetical protein n=1 Tax=Halomonas sp. BMC6 TaxID=3073244 RepID=UPI0030D538FC
MANATAQISEIDAIFSEVDALDALDELDFETEESAPVVEEEEILEAAQEELTAEEIAEAEEVTEEAESEVEVSIDEVEKELKTAEREARLEQATLSEEEAEATKMSIGKEATKKLTKRPSVAANASKEAINVADVLDAKVAASDAHWGFIAGEEAEATKARILSACDTIPKKTREKVVNLMDWWVRGHSLSVYTSIAFSLLVEEGVISSASLRNRYLSNPGKSYTMGTANAQTGQVMKLLTVFGMIDSDGEVVSDHPMIERFIDLKKAA